MIGGILLGGWTVALCAWMAFGESSDWQRQALKYLLMIAAFVTVGVLAFWLVQGFGYLG